MIDAISLDVSGVMSEPAFTLVDSSGLKPLELPRAVCPPSADAVSSFNRAMSNPPLDIPIHRLPIAQMDSGAASRKTVPTPPVDIPVNASKTLNLNQNIVNFAPKVETFPNPPVTDLNPTDPPRSPRPLHEINPRTVPIVNPEPVSVTLGTIPREVPVGVPKTSIFNPIVENLAPKVGAVPNPPQTEPVHNPPREINPEPTPVTLGTVPKEIPVDAPKTSIFNPIAANLAPRVEPAPNSPRVETVPTPPKVETFPNAPREVVLETVPVSKPVTNLNPPVVEMGTVPNPQMGTVPTSPEPPRSPRPLREINPEPAPINPGTVPTVNPEPTPATFGTVPREDPVDAPKTSIFNPIVANLAPKVETVPNPPRVETDPTPPKVEPAPNPTREAVLETVPVSKPVTNINPPVVEVGTAPNPQMGTVPTSPESPRPLREINPEPAPINPGTVPTVNPEPTPVTFGTVPREVPVDAPKTSDFNPIAADFAPKVGTVPNPSQVEPVSNPPQEINPETAPVNPGTVPAVNPKTVPANLVIDSKPLDSKPLDSKPLVTDSKPLSPLREEEEVAVAGKKVAHETEALQAVDSTKVVPQTVDANPVVAGQTVNVVLDPAAATARTNELVEAANEIADTILVTQSLVRGDGEVTIRLKPTVLDGSQIRLEAKGSAITIEVTPANVDVAAAVERSRARFEQTLSERLPSFQFTVRVFDSKKSRTER